MKDKTNILFIGDVIGEPGLKILESELGNIISEHNIDFTIANAENISNGIGLLEKDANRLLNLNIDVLTGGNHTMDKIQSHKYINESERILRPLNYPKGAYGKGYGIYKIPKSEKTIGVINLQGRIYMKPIDCPFRTFDNIYENIKDEVDIIIVDFHAEITAEKMAFGWYADGRANAVIGTHTHIPTADARILTKGTAYITDVGMAGPFDSVIGMNKESSIKRFIYATPQKFEVAQNDSRICGVIIKINNKTNKTEKIETLIKPDLIK
ncbi:MAG: TIGR00282 family metallophosphoesterase [Ignavibacteria bacterium]|nr:TIGR00282 family metallophosphoesterase [Ignavibacteria bacterium]